MFHKNAVLKRFCKIPTNEPVIEYFIVRLQATSSQEKNCLIEVFLMTFAKISKTTILLNNSEQLLSFQEYLRHLH